MKVPIDTPSATELERHKAEKLLPAAWSEGINSGDIGEVDFAELKQEARASARSLPVGMEGVRRGAA